MSDTPQQATQLKLSNPTEVRALLEGPTVALAEFLTGVLAQSGAFPESYILATGRIVQSAIKGNLITQLGKEINKYREEGRIKEDYFATNKNQVSLHELLKFIDGEIPDEEVFKAMKSIYLSGISTDADSQKEEIAYQFLLLCKKLTSMDILILKTCYKIHKGEITDVNTGMSSYGDWVNAISRHIGYDLPELVSAADDNLVELGLLTARNYGDKSGIAPSKSFRLTNLGLKLCDFITNFE